MEMNRLIGILTTLQQEKTVTVPYLAENSRLLAVPSAEI